MMRVMTFNLRFENDRDGDDCWKNRRAFLVDVVLGRSPSLLGTQEGTPAQLGYLQEHLHGYRMHAPVRPLDETCQYPTLFYLEKRFRLQEGGEFWLSRTPAVHRSKDWDSAFPRMMGYGLFEDLECGKVFWAAVTHLDHIGKEARTEQARRIVEWMQGRLQEPRVLMGDFNDLPGSSAHRILTAPDSALQDSWVALAREEGEQSMTHHDFKGVPQKCRMDWILVSHHFLVLDAFVFRDHLGNRYPSDHFPYAVDLDWAGRSPDPQLMP